MDSLEKWKTQLRSFAFRNALINRFPYDKLNDIIQNIREFFSENYFSETELKSNFLIPILNSPGMSSMLKMCEFSHSINFLRKYPKIYKSVSGNQVNNREVRDRLFELFVNSTFNENGLNINLEDTYESAKNISKPLDGSFTFKNQKYLIECKKVYNEKEDHVQDIIDHLNQLLSKFNQNLTHLQLFGGYVIFKKDSISGNDKNLVERKLLELAKAFFNEAKNNYTESQKLVHTFENENLKISFMSHFFLKHKKKDIKQSNSNIMIFDTELKNGLMGLVDITFEIKLNYLDVTNFIAQKVKKKVQQHRMARGYHRIITMEFENIRDIVGLRNSLSVSKEIFSNRKIKSKISNNCSLFIILKDISDMYQIEYSLLASSEFDPDLRKILTNLKIHWR